MLIKIISILAIAGSFNLYADDVSTPAVPATTTTTTTTTVAPPFGGTPSTIMVPTPPSTGTPGGYNDVSVKDPEVQAAAKFAVNQIQQGNLVSVVSAQMQVVAGKNFQMQLILAQKSGNYQYGVTVFVPLPSSNQPMQLTNVQAMGLVDGTATGN